jgi:amino acid adenylation domain-containing protein
MDGWSVPVVLREVFAVYRSLLEKTVLALPAPVPYENYLRWAQQQSVERAESYWNERLGSIGETPRISVMKKAAQSAAPIIHERAHPLSSALQEAMDSLSRTRGLTLNTIVQTVWSILLSRYCGQSRVQFGTVVSGRHGEVPGIESLVGLLINTLPMQAEVNPGLTVSQYMTELQNKNLEQLTFDYLPLTEMQAGASARSGRRREFFDNIVIVENYPLDRSSDEDLEKAGLSISESRIREQTDYPLALIADKDADRRLTLRIAFDENLFDVDTIDRMLNHYQEILQSAVEHPEQCIWELPMQTAVEAKQIEDWNRTGKEYERDLSIQQLFERQVERSPQASAVRFGEEELSYAELNRRANRLGWYLRAQGVGPDVLVGICVERSLEMMVGLLGILKAGGAYVPLDPGYPEERLQFMLQDAQLSLLLAQTGTSTRVERAGLPIFTLDRDWARLSEYSTSNLPLTTTEANLAYVIYTSGSTGTPKGVMIAHHSLCNLAQAQAEAFRIDATSRVLQFASLNFDAAVSEWSTALITGACLILAPARSAAENLPQLLQQTATTVVTLPPTVLATLSEKPSSLRTLIVAGEACPTTLSRKWSCDKEMLNAYGPTENTVCATISRPLQPADLVIPIGRAISNTSVYVLDEEMQAVGIGVGGEIYLGGAGLARGYANRGGLTAERFVPNPIVPGGERLYRTGDQGRWLSEGQLEYLGRLDGQVKVRGYRIELGEIEAILGRADGVRAAVVVVAGGDGGLEKRLLGYVVGAEAGSSSVLRSYLKGKLPEYMVPAQIVKLEHMPLTPNGKVDRKALPEPEVLGAEREAGYVAPGTELESRLCAIWAKVLGVPRVGVHDNFFDLGGHSLSLIRLRSEAQVLLGRDLPLVDFFTYPTIRALNRYLTNVSDSEKPSSQLQDQAKLKRGYFNRLRDKETAQK